MKLMNRFTVLRFMLLLIAPALLLSYALAPERVNLSGTWNLNESKSELGNFVRFTTRKIKVEQKDDAIIISKTSPSRSGEDVTTIETLSFDGKESESTVFGSSKKKSTAKWSEDGKSFNVNYTIALERNGETNNINGTETWTLTNDGKSLSLQTVSASPQGERTIKAIYDKE
jgi:hypothetical protein